MEKKKHIFELSIIGLIYFIFGFVTWINGTLISFMKVACNLSDFAAYLVTFAFYISYFVWAIPSSYVLKRSGFKKGIGIGLFVMAFGAMLFIPAAYAKAYPLFLVALFILGSGLALMQTAVNPYVTILGPIESAAKRISIMGICNKFAGIIAPVILASVLFFGMDSLVGDINDASSVEMQEQFRAMLMSRLIKPYAIMSVILVLLGIFVMFIKLPEIKEDLLGGESGQNSFWHDTRLWFGVIALFFYVGVEVIAGDTIINYGMSLGVAQESAKYFTSLTLISMVIGYFVGVILIPKYINQRQALIGCAVLGILLTVASIATPTDISINFPFIDLGTFSQIQMHVPLTVLFVALLGLANSLVWPAIWPLALEHAGNHTKMGSAILIMSIAGGAILPLLYGKIADCMDTQTAYFTAIPCYVIILAFALYCKTHKIKQS